MDREFLQQVKGLFNQCLGSRIIAKQLNVTRYQVQKAYKELGLYNSKRKSLKKPIPKEKSCKICQKVKQITQFRQRNRNGKVYFEVYCTSCEKEYNKDRCKKYYSQNKDFWVQYRKDNRDKINEGYRTRYSRIEVKIRRRCSHAIRKALQIQKETSCMNKLPFSIEELKNHLETQFEDWMRWDNWGSYTIDTWNDNDSLTWTWQIDHIMPQSKLPYDSMNHSNFRKCWSLNNLRPLSSKQNLEKSNNNV